MSNKVISQKLTSIIIATVILLGILLRLQNFNLLPMDGHPMRQTDTESVAYNFAFRDHNILYPQNSLIRPITNANAYFLLEFPVYQYIIAIFYMIFGWHIEIARILNLIFFVIAAWNLYYFVKYYFSITIALFTLIFFTFSPSSIFFIGHAIHPDVFSVMMMTIALSTYIKWRKSNYIWWFAGSCIALSLSVATRPFALLILPAFLFMLWDLKAKRWEYIAITVSSILTYGLWYLWTKTFKALADHSWENWVLLQRKEFFQPEVLFNVMIKKNLAGEVLGKFTSIFVIIGFITFVIKRNKKFLFLLSWIAGIPVYWYVVPAGNWFHQYYANVYMIPLLITAAWGVTYILELLKKYSFTKLLIYPVIFVIILLSLYNGYRTSNYFFKDIIPQADIQIAQEIDKIVPMESRVLYLEVLNSIPISLYHRKGWVLGAGPVDVPQDVDEILRLRQYGLEYIVESKRSPTLSPMVMNELLEYIELEYSSEVSNIYKVKQ